MIEEIEQKHMLELSHEPANLSIVSAVTQYGAVVYLEWNDT